MALSLGLPRVAVSDHHALELFGLSSQNIGRLPTCLLHYFTILIYICLVITMRVQAGIHCCISILIVLAQDVMEANR